MTFKSTDDISIKSQRLKETLDFGKDYFSDVFTVAGLLGKGQTAVDAAEVFIFLLNWKGRFLQSDGIALRLSMEPNKVKRAIRLLKELGYAEYEKRSLKWTGKDLDDSGRWASPLLVSLTRYQPNTEEWWNLMTLIHCLESQKTPVCPRRTAICICMGTAYRCGKRNTPIVDRYLRNLTPEILEQWYFNDNFFEEFKETVRKDIFYRKCLREYQAAKLCLFGKRPVKSDMAELLRKTPWDLKEQNKFLYIWYVSLPMKDKYDDTEERPAGLAEMRERLLDVIKRGPVLRGIGSPGSF